MCIGKKSDDDECMNGCTGTCADGTNSSVYPPVISLYMFWLSIALKIVHVSSDLSLLDLHVDLDLDLVRSYIMYKSLFFIF